MLRPLFFRLLVIRSVYPEHSTLNQVSGGEIGVWNLGYTPVIGDSFVVTTFDERLPNSTFSSLSMHGFGRGVNFGLLYHEHDVTLVVTAVPEPEQYLMLLAGLGLMGVAARRRRNCTQVCGETI